MAGVSSVANKEEIKGLIENGYSYQEISNHYSFLYPLHKGLSKRSVRRFCKVNEINRNVSMGKIEIDQLMRKSVDEVPLSCFLSYFCRSSKKTVLFLSFSKSDVQYASLFMIMEKVARSTNICIDCYSFLKVSDRKK